MSTLAISAFCRRRAGDEAVSILVSRSALSGYVQITRVTAGTRGRTHPGCILSRR
jgi:hypothetical protein